MECSFLENNKLIFFRVFFFLHCAKKCTNEIQDHEAFLSDLESENLKKLDTKLFS